VRGVNIFTIVVVITTVSIRQRQRSENGRKEGKIPENDRRAELVQKKSGGLWAQQRLVTLPGCVGDDPFLAERSAVRVGRAVQGNVSEQDQGRVFA
jgi:hypothetical protein